MEKNAVGILLTDSLYYELKPLRNSRQICSVMKAQQYALVFPERLYSVFHLNRFPSVVYPSDTVGLLIHSKDIEQPVYNPYASLFMMEKVYGSVMFVGVYMLNNRQIICGLSKQAQQAVISVLNSIKTQGIDDFMY